LITPKTRILIFNRVHGIYEDNRVSSKLKGVTEKGWWQRL